MPTLNVRRGRSTGPSKEKESNNGKGGGFFHDKRGRSASTRHTINAKKDGIQFKRGKSMPGKLNRFTRLFEKAPLQGAPPDLTDRGRRRKQSRSRSHSQSSTRRSRSATRSTGSRRSSSRKDRGSSDTRGSHSRVGSSKSREREGSSKNMCSKSKEQEKSLSKRRISVKKESKPSSSRRESARFSKGTRKTGLGTAKPRQTRPNKAAAKLSEAAAAVKPRPKHQSTKRKSETKHPTTRHKGKTKQRSKSMPPHISSTPFKTLYRKRRSSIVSSLPSMDSSWRYQHVKLSREMKMKYKAKQRACGRGAWEIPEDDPNMSFKEKQKRHAKRKEERNRGRQRRNTQHMPRSRDIPRESRYRSKSVDSVFAEPRRTKNQFDMSIVPYEDDVPFEKYDHADLWEDELFKSNYNDLPVEPLDDDDATPVSLNLYSSNVRMNYEMSPEDWNYVNHDPIHSLPGSSFHNQQSNDREEGLSLKDTHTKESSKSDKATPSRGGKTSRPNDFGMSISINDLEEDANRSETSSNASGRDNSSGYGSSSIAPPLHSQVRANMPPSFPFPPKPSGPPKPKKTALVRNALTHSKSLHEDELTSGKSQGEISELTNPTYAAPPMHSEIRSKMPSRKSSAGSVAHSDMVSALSMPSALNSAAHVPPMLSEVLKHKPGNSVSGSSLGGDSGMAEPSVESYRLPPQSKEHQRTNSKEFRPPPPRPPPPRTKPPNSSRRAEHSEDPANAFLKRALPPLKEEIYPTKSQEYEQQNSKSFELSSNVIQLNNAAAELLMMQGMDGADFQRSSPRKSPNPSPSNPTRNLSRSYSHPANNDLPLSRMQSQPTIRTPPLEKDSSTRLNNSSLGLGLLNPGRVVHRHRKVDQMPFTDEFGDSGLYSGEVNEDTRPNGQGRMKYDNGVFFEGKWNSGVREGNLAQRERMLSGFSSWKGAPKKGGGNNTVHGMPWIDRLGKSGSYTGDINEQSQPHGKGVMKYDFGLIAEGEWVNGLLVGGQETGMAAGAFAGQTVMGGMQGSIYPGMGAATMVSGMGMGGVSVFPQQQQHHMGNVMMYGNPQMGPQNGPPTFIRKNTDMDEDVL